MIQICVVGLGKWLERLKLWSAWWDLRRVTALLGKGVKEMHLGSGDSPPLPMSAALIKA